VPDADRNRRHGATLEATGWTVDLATDERADKYGFEFPARQVHIVPAETIRSTSPVALAKTAAQLGRGFWKAWNIMRTVRPHVVAGFGGYPTLPPLLAAKVAGVPTVLHEANAVMGRANKFLAGRVDRLATSWPTTRFVEGALAAKSVVTGIPVRPAVIAAAEMAYEPPRERLRLLVFGGSQGARVFADLMPPALAALDVALRQRLDVTQQVRPEDMERVTSAYRECGIAAECQPFFPDLPRRMAGAHLVVARSGASTVAELAVIGRPGLLVPLPHALDADQLENARALANAGGAVVAEQRTLVGDVLTRHLSDLLLDPARLATMALAARTVGVPDAVARLADLLEATAAAQA
jgi:UDP-N-acetylglucosamine--N-acetylmuramyl-(pentapeptide) pyrophosphoryl-undecaprenol N-acetylglucosamine transferase